MKKWFISGVIGLIISIIVFFLTYYVIGNPQEMATPNYVWFYYSLLIYFVPLLIGGFFLDLAKRNRFFAILAIIFFLIPILITIFFIMVGLAFKNIT